MFISCMNQTHTGSGPTTITLKFLAACTTSPMSALGFIIVNATSTSLKIMRTVGLGCRPAVDVILPPAILK